MLLVKPLYVKFTTKDSSEHEFRKIEGEEVEMMGINPSLNSGEDTFQ
jgi:hypothetical protein